MYIGHRREDGKEQALEDHLMGTARFASAFASDFGAQEHAYRMALLHDLGKYAEKVQRRLRDPEHVAKCDHSTAGAKEAMALGDYYAAFAVAGHHSGLLDRGAKMATKGDGTLMGRMKTDVDGACRMHLNELNLSKQVQIPVWLSKGTAYAQTMYIRMLFSCLVDADFLDTERFMRDECAPRGEGESLEVLLQKLQAYIGRWFPPKGVLNEKRCDILKNCLDGASYEKGLYTLTVPTGGGKTVSSLAFALTHAVRHGMKRVIYVVPYTSIIEQNSAVFAEILGEANVLEHHSGVDYEDKDDDVDVALLRKRLATENWDMPIVVTTAVQFFESLHASRTSRCRKLHHMSDAVIVFDEAQMLPLPFLKPCVAAIAELVQHYGTTAILCTATQPALGNLFYDYAPDLSIREVIGNASQMYEFFRRVRFEYAGKWSDEEVALRMDEQEQVLCIVNSRKRARTIFEAMTGDGRFHLSTLMTPADRRRTIETIRGRLKQGLPCRVVSTSLIEAGVDVDFPHVLREIAGLDSILQAAGRCNREGKRLREQSVVSVFEADGGVPSLFRMQVEATNCVFRSGLEMDSPEAIRMYFEHLLKMKGAAELDNKDILGLSKELKFRQIAHEFRLIDNNTYTIYIPNEENRQLLDALRNGQYGKQTFRQLQKDAVNVYEKHYQSLAGAGLLEPGQKDFFILRDTQEYDPQTGLSLTFDPGQALFG